MSLSRLYTLTRQKIFYHLRITPLLQKNPIHHSNHEHSPSLHPNKGSHFHHSTFKNRHWFSTIQAHDDVSHDSNGTQLSRASFSSEKPVEFSKVDARLLPTVLLIGRPNVGKSALFNRLIKRREALVYNTPNDHVTRDIREGIAKLGDLRFRVLDSAGLEAEASSGSVLGRTAEMTANVLRMSSFALFLIDASIGLSFLHITTFRNVYPITEIPSEHKAILNASRICKV